jgi:hypothetical protein
MAAYFLIILAIVTRFIPHMNNVSAVTAVAIFSGAFLPKKQAFIVPLVARFVSDIFLGFFAWQIMLAVYASHLLGVLFGIWIKHSSAQSVRWVKIITSSLASAGIFFLVTNFAFLYSSYPHTFSGVLLAYANGLPFLRGTVLGDVGYVVGLFGLYQAAGYLSAYTRRSRTIAVID